MMIRQRQWVAVLLGVCFLAGGLYAGDKVLLVQSYHTGYPWVDSITEGVKKGLEGTGLELEIFYMDTKRKTSEEWKVESGKKAMEKVNELKPVVVITGDDNAQQYFAKELAGKDTPAVVFCGVNAEASKYGYENQKNVTGVLERPHFAETIKLLQSVNPNIKKVALMTDDGPTSQAVVDFLKTQKVPADVVAYEMIGTLDDWKAAVAKHNEDADAIVVFNYHTIKEKAGDEESMDPSAVMTWTVDNCTVLLGGLMPFNITDGCVVGIVESGEEHGHESAVRAAAIAKGEKKASDFPISTAEKGAIMVNMKIAEAKKILIPAEVIEAADEVVK